MKKGDIIKQVRWCIDEEEHFGDFENTYMDNIIVAKMDDALRWVTLNADSALLSGSDEKSKTPGILHDYTLPNDQNAEHSGTEPVLTNGIITLPLNTVKVVRVRVSGWHRAVMTPIAEDSDEYLMQSDADACATKERPMAALIESYPPRIELFPKPESSDKVEITIATESEETEGDSDWTKEDTVALPPKSKSAYLYYIAFLVLCAFGDINKANAMLNIAKMELGGVSQ